MIIEIPDLDLATMTMNELIEMRLKVMQYHADLKAIQSTITTEHDKRERAAKAVKDGVEGLDEEERGRLLDRNGTAADYEKLDKLQAKQGVKALTREQRAAMKKAFEEMEQEEGL